MRQIPIHNPGPRVLYVGAGAVVPGETRLFDLADVPPHLRPRAAPAPAPEPAPDPVLVLLDKPVREIAAAIEARDKAGAPQVHDADLARLAAAEGAGKTRKSLMEAIAAEQLRRAQERAEAGAGGTDERTENDREGTGSGQEDGGAGDRAQERGQGSPPL